MSLDGGGSEPPPFFCFSDLLRENSKDQMGRESRDRRRSYDPYGDHPLDSSIELNLGLLDQTSLMHH